MTSAPNALQQGEAYAAMLTNNPGLSIRQLAADLGCDERFVTRRLQLLQLIPELQQALHAGRLSYTQARQLAPLSFGQQLRAARNVRPPAAPTQTNREAARARRGANALRQGETYAAMLANNPGRTIHQLAVDLGLSHNDVRARLKLLQLIPELQKALREGRLSIGRARQLSCTRLPVQRRAAKELRSPTARTRTTPGATALQQGETYAALLANNPGRTIHQLAIDLGLHPIYVTRRLRLLSLIPELQKALCEGRLSYSRAWPLSQASTSEQQCVARALSGASATATPDGRPTGRTTTHHLETA